METSVWLSLTEYAHKKNVSISTLRRKIKSEAIPFKMDEGRYLLLDEGGENSTNNNNATDARIFPQQASEAVISQAAQQQALGLQELHWKALEARVAGLARKVDLMSEQMSELKMLVQIFEEKLEQERE